MSTLGHLVYFWHEHSDFILDD